MRLQLTRSWLELPPTAGTGRAELRILVKMSRERVDSRPSMPSIPHPLTKRTYLRTWSAVCSASKVSVMRAWDEDMSDVARPHLRWVRSTCVCIYVCEREKEEVGRRRDKGGVRKT